jgi:hypothetical protein
MQGDLTLQDRLPNNEFTTRFYDDGRVIESQVPENREQYIYTIRGGSDLSLPANLNACGSGAKAKVQVSRTPPST